MGGLEKHSKFMGPYWEFIPPWPRPPWSMGVMLVPQLPVLGVFEERLMLKSPAIPLRF